MAEQGGFKELIKKRPKPPKGSDEFGPIGSSSYDDQRPRLYLRDAMLPAGTLDNCELGEKYLVEVEMVSKEIREKTNDGGTAKTVSADFLVTSFNPSAGGAEEDKE